VNGHYFHHARNPRKAGLLKRLNQILLLSDSAIV
jgi:hypothetical protein